MKILPQARNTGIVIQHADQELLVYDLVTHKAFNLNETAMNVFNCCDGETTFDALQSKYNLTAEIVYLALDELKKRDLLEENAAYESPFVNLSRREAIRRAGLASMAALPVISSLVAPSAVSAASGCIQPGLNPNAQVTDPRGLLYCTTDCSNPTVTGRCCSNSARAGGACVEDRTRCLCN